METKYFVLKPKGSSEYARASRVAMRVFAAEIEQSNPRLCSEVKSWAYDEERNATTGGWDANRQATGSN